MKLRTALLLCLVTLTACAGTTHSVGPYELPAGYVARHATPSARERAERVAAAELERRGWRRESGAKPLEIVVVPALRQSALQRAGGIEWDATSTDDHVVVVAVRDGTTGQIVYETVLAEADEP